MSRVFVTGTNGFIGSHLAHALLERGHDVVGLVRPTSDLRSLQPLFERYGSRLRLVVGDLRTGAGLEAGLAGAEYVYHLGGVLMGVSEDEFRHSIVTGTQNLLDAVGRTRTPALQRFVYVSSQAAAGPSPTEQAVDETATPRPVSWYGTSKKDAEEIVLRHGAAGLPITIIRPVGVYGERERDISGGTFATVSMGILPRLGFGRKTISMVYVGDVVDLMITGAESPQGVGHIYFAADKAPIPQASFLTAIADALETKVRISLPTPTFLLPVVAWVAEAVHAFTRERPMLTRDKVREMRQTHWAAAPVAAMRDFHWVPRTTLAEGLRRAVADWRARTAEERRVTAEPFRERAIRTYAVATLLGAVTEILAEIGKWYEFHPRWLIFPVIAAYGVVFGSWAMLSARWGRLVQFLGGAVMFMIAELSNHWYFHYWEFAPEPFGGLPVPWVRALVLSVPIGLIPVATNLISGAVYKHRLRVG